MNKYLLYHGAFAAVCASAVAPIYQNARAADSSAPSAITQLPINLARADVGSRLEAREPKGKNTQNATIEENDSALALIGDDAALTYPLKAGRTSLIVTLVKIQVLNHLNFIDFGAEGKYSVSVSSTKLGFDADGWRPVVSGESFGGAKVAAADFGIADVRYVKIDFDTEVPGRISDLGLFGTPTIGSFHSKPQGFTAVNGSAAIAQVSSQASRNYYFDVASLNAGARVVALSRGGDLDRAQSMIDGNAESSYAFDSTDPAPSVVVDLGAQRKLNRLSCVFEAPAGRLDFYLVDNPYRSEQRAMVGYVDSPTVQPVSNPNGFAGLSSVTAGRQAIYSVDTSAQPGLNRLAADLSGQQGRFLVAEFHPIATAAPAGDFKDADYKDKPDFKDFKDQAAAGTPSQPLRILSLSAFGQIPATEIVPQIPPPSPNTPGGVTPVPPILPPGSGTITP